MSTRNNIYNMKKSFFVLLMLTCSFAHLGADSTFKGQRVYLNECRVCHLSSKIFIETHTFDEWNKILDNDGIKLSAIHLNQEVKKVMSKENIVKNSHSYFSGDTYKETYESLRLFIIKASEKNENRPTE